MVEYEQQLVGRVGLFQAPPRIVAGAEIAACSLGTRRGARCGQAAGRDLNNGYESHKSEHDEADWCSDRPNFGELVNDVHPSTLSECRRVARNFRDDNGLVRRRGDSRWPFQLRA